MSSEKATRGAASSSTGMIESVLEAPRQLIKESAWLLKRCNKPSKDEFIAISRAVATGFLIMGFTGYFVKLVHIPINNIIVGGA